MLANRVFSRLSSGGFGGKWGFEGGVNQVSKQVEREKKPRDEK